MDGAEGHATRVPRFEFSVVVVVISLFLAAIAVDAILVSSRSGRGPRSISFAVICSDAKPGKQGAPLEKAAFEMKAAKGAFGVVQGAERESFEGVERPVEILADLAEGGEGGGEGFEFVGGDGQVHEYYTGYASSMVVIGGVGSVGDVDSSK